MLLGQENGWMDVPIFASWAKKVFVPHVTGVRERYSHLADEPALLWVDGHSSRCNAEFIEACRAAHITVASFPAHTTTILQPLDCGVLRVFKSSLPAKFRVATVEYLENHSETERKNIPALAGERRCILFQAAKGSLYKAHDPEIISKTFANCGLVPWKPASVLQSPEKVNSNPIPPPPQRTAINISGRVLTNEDLLLEIAAAKLVKQEKIRLKAEKETRKEAKKLNQNLKLG